MAEGDESDAHSHAGFFSDLVWLEMGMGMKLESIPEHKLRISRA